MKKRVLSLCLSLTIMMTAGGVSGLAVSASEVAGEGSSTGAMEETEYSDPSEEEDGYAEEGETTSEIAVPEDVMLTPAEAAALSDNTAADTADTAAAAEEIPTDAAGQVIAPETAEAIDNADVGATDLQQTARDEASSVANGAEEAMQAPESADAEMNKSTIGAAFDSAYEFVKEDAIVIGIELGIVVMINWGLDRNEHIELNTAAHSFSRQLYDEIGAALLIPKVRKSRADDFRSIEQFYQVKFLHRDPDEVLSDDDDDDEDDTYDSGSGLHGSIGGSDTTFRVSGTPEDFGDSK